MPLGKPMTVHEASAELRAKAARQRVEIERIPDPSTPDGLSHPVSMLLAIAFVDAVNDEWDAHAALATGEKRLVFERAIKLARTQHNPVPGDEMHRIITSLAPRQPPCVAVIKGRDWSGPEVEHTVHALQYNIVGAQPIWARYLHEASLQLAAEAEAKAAETS